jgi:hypothetical protein
MLKRTELRFLPSGMIRSCRMIPSCFAPMRRIATLDFSFSSSVVNCTPTDFMNSNAWTRRRYFASVLTADRWTDSRAVYRNKETWFCPQFLCSESRRRFLYVAMKNSFGFSSAQSGCSSDWYTPQRRKVFSTRSVAVIRTPFTIGSPVEESKVLPGCTWPKWSMYTFLQAETCIEISAQRVSMHFAIATCAKLAAKINNAVANRFTVPKEWSAMVARKSSIAAAKLVSENHLIGGLRELQLCPNSALGQQPNQRSWRSTITVPLGR